MSRWPLLLCAIPFAVPRAHGEDAYPNGPVTIICPWSAGGGTDGLSRQLAMLLEQKLDTPFNVVNQTGGQGVTGHSYGAGARADGHTLTMMTAELNMLHWRGLTDIRCDSFTSLMMLNRDSAALLVRTDTPWNTLRELEAEIRRRPGELTCSGTAKGATWHLGFAGWLDASGFDPATVKWIPTRGASPSLRELVAGGLDMVCCSLPEAGPLIDAGRVRGLGVMADERVAGFEDVKTFKEQGIDWTLGGWRALGVPAGTPDVIVDRLRTALRKIVKEEGFTGFMTSRGFGIAIEEGEQLDSSFATMDAQMGRLLTDEKFAKLFESDYGPMLYPRAIGCVLLAVLAGLLIGSDRRHIAPVIVVASVIGWLLLTPWLGFVISSMLLLLVNLLALGNRLRVSAAITVVLVTVVYYVFSASLGVPLPRGELFR